MRIRRWAPPLAALALVGAIPGAADSAAPAIPAPALVPAILPAQLQALEQRMEGLQVNGERYSLTVESVPVTVTKQSGKHITQTKPLVRTDFGEASLVPGEGEIFSSDNRRRPAEISVGSTLYVYTPGIARTDGGRPWVRFDGGALGDRTLFPFHGQPAEVNAGGVGSYAGLINLIATAVGPVAVVGPVAIDGQQTIEFTAAVEPVRLVRGLSLKQLASVRKSVPPETLDVFLTESGLPLRVAVSLTLGTVSLLETTDVLALNVPLHVKLPAARRTIGQRQLSRLESESQHSNGSSGASISGGFTIETQ
jgi:hypothetical protein